MSDSKITVLSTVFNGVQFIERCVESVLSQTFTDFEYLIVDDGSSDGSADALSKLPSVDARIRILTMPSNQGRVAAANFGVSHASTPFVAELDIDDLMRPNRLKDQYDLLLSNPQLGVVGGGYVRSDSINGTQQTVRPPGTHEQLVTRLARYLPFAHSVATFRVQAFTDAGGFKIHDLDDAFLWLEMVKAGWRLGSASTVVGEHFVYENSAFYGGADKAERQLRQAKFHRAVIRELRLPKYNYAYPIARGVFSKAPPALNRNVRKVQRKLLR